MEKSKIFWKFLIILNFVWIVNLFYHYSIEDLYKLISLNLKDYLIFILSKIYFFRIQKYCSPSHHFMFSKTHKTGSSAVFVGLWIILFILNIYIKHLFKHILMRFGINHNLTFILPKGGSTFLMVRYQPF